MKSSEIIDKLNEFRGGKTEQNWTMEQPKYSQFLEYENEYIKVLRIDSSNKAGGAEVQNGKQWGIIVEIKKAFESLPNWKTLKKEMGEDIAITPLTRGKNKGKHGIRLYKMSKNMNDDIIKKLLNFIFE